MVAKESPGEIASDTAAALLAAGAGAVVAGPGGALVGAGSGPVLTAALRDVVTRVTARRMRRSGEAFSLAAVLAGLPEEELAARIATNDRLAELASRVLAFVQDVSLADKRRALAATLARAAQGEQTIAELDRAMVLAAALASLDAPHLRGMVALKPGCTEPNCC